MIRYILITILVLIPTTVTAKQITAEQVIDKVKQTYKNLDEFKADAIHVVEVNGEYGFKSESSFKIKLKKPDYFLITSDPNSEKKIAIWNDEEGAFMYFEHMSHIEHTKNQQSYIKATSSIDVLGGAVAVNMEDIPSIFFSLNTDKSGIIPLNGLRNIVFEGNEKIDGVDCYIIKGDSPHSREVKYWISEKTYLIHKMLLNHNQPDDYVVDETIMTDEEIEELLAEYGQTPTKEAIEKYKLKEEKDKKWEIEMNSFRKKALKESPEKLEDNTIILYKNISTSLSADELDFSFPIPDDAKEINLFDKLLSE